MKEITDIIVIGGGPAGMTACLYALRNGKSVVLIERNGIGGQIAQSPRVENFPSVDSISGSELADKMFEQITSRGAIFKFGNVESVEKEGEVFTVKTDFDTMQARSVIIATGVEHRKLNLKNEDKLIGNGISYCALCDGAFYSGEDVTLIGDGNTALQYALLLSSYCKSVHIVTLFDKFFGDASLVAAVKKRDNIKITHSLRLVELLGEDELRGLVFEREDKTRVEFPTKALFVAIGQVPDNHIFSGLVDLSVDGYIAADENLKTRTPGLFVAGDCRTKKVRQVTTACADGAIAASNASNYIESLG